MPERPEALGLEALPMSDGCANALGNRSEIEGATFVMLIDIGEIDSLHDLPRERHSFS